jgi:hypothetical protein
MYSLTGVGNLNNTCTKYLGLYLIQNTMYSASYAMNSANDVSGQLLLLIL